MKLYNTLTRQKRRICTSGHEGKVKMYVCGTYRI